MIAWRFIAFAFCCFQYTGAVAEASSPVVSPAIVHLSDKPVILVLGDSLSAEYGLRRDSGWVALLEQKLQQEGKAYRIQNASISGDTSSGGLSRLPDALAAHKPAVVLLELGGNDALRGLALSMTEKNLDSMVRLSQDIGAKVLLLGMQIPPNYGQKYAEQFRLSFVHVAEKRGAALVPFLLEGIANDRSQFQADGIHPNEQAQAVLLENVWAKLQPLLNE